MVKEHLPERPARGCCPKFFGEPEGFADWDEAGDYGKESFLFEQRDFSMSGGEDS